MHVMTVDFTSPQASDLFCESLKNTGFAVLTNHPISTDLIKQAYQQWEAFFGSEGKHDYVYQKPRQDGYFPFRTENAKDSKISDLKEFYHYYPSGKVPPELNDITAKMYQSLQQLAVTLLRWIEMHLPVEVVAQLSMPLNQMIQKSPNTLLRILHYPPLKDQVEEGAIRAAAHEDINLITILPAATAPGLEVLDTKGQWHAVTCDPGNIVVNVGDMLQMCTQHYYKSTTHRVTNPTGEAASLSRYSMPLFLHPRDEVMLSATHSAVQYRHERLRAIGIY